MSQTVSLSSVAANFLLTASSLLAFLFLLSPPRSLFLLSNLKSAYFPLSSLMQEDAGRGSRPPNT